MEWRPDTAKGRPGRVEVCRARRPVEGDGQRAQGLARQGEGREADRSEADRRAAQADPTHPGWPNDSGPAPGASAESQCPDVRSRLQQRSEGSLAEAPRLGLGLEA